MDAIEAGSSELGAASGTHNFERDFGHCCVVGMDAGGGNEWKLHKLPHILHVYCMYVPCAAVALGMRRIPYVVTPTCA
jgi:hypothetical protein